MNLNPDDPRLTAYALGELPESERAAIETELQQSPECRKAVEEIQQAAKLLSHELANEPCPELLPAQKETIAARLESSKIVEFPRRTFATRLTALAACILVVLTAFFWFSNAARKPAPQKPAAVAVSKNPIPSNPQVTPPTAPSPVRDDVKDALLKEPKVAVATSENSSAATDKVFWDKSWDNLVVSAPPAPPPAQSTAATTLSLKLEGEKQNNQEVAMDSTARSKAVTDAFNFQNSGQFQQSQSATAPAQSVNQVESKRRAAAPESSEQKLSGLLDQKPPSESTRHTTGQPQLVDSFGSAREQLEVPPASSTWSGGGGGGVRGFYDDTLKKSGNESVREQPDVASDAGFYRLERRARDGDSAQYPHLTENTFFTALSCPLSTFSIDVDTASYANMRRFLNENRLPPHDAVRVEELINYFPYHYPPPRGDDPFSASIEVAGCPWNSEHRLVRIGLKGREVARDKRPASNFVFLIDVSGSMQPRERLPLIKEALRQLVKKMSENDRVAIVTYASSAGTRLESTSCAEKEKILRAIDELEAGGSTNGGDGIQQAYRVAEENYLREGVNRVLLCTDGDFNVGITDQNQLVHMIQQKAKSGVFLTTLGVGTDNYKDALMQRLADKGNGNYHYLDSLEEAQKVLIEQMNGTLVTIAKDVKLQLEFNPAQVNAYRLVGYEKRMLRKEDFNNDAKDAGEIGAGHTVTALYEIVPAGKEVQGAVDDLKYQPPSGEKPDRYTNTSSKSRELLTLKLRYKQPDGDRSRLLEVPVTDNGKRFSNASADFRFAAAVASFGMLLRDSEYKGDTSFDTVLEWAGPAKGADEEGYRAEFLNLVRKAKQLR